MHVLGVQGVVVAAILRDEDALDDESLVATVSVIEVFNLKSHIDGRVAVVNGIGQVINRLGRRCAADGSIGRHIHEYRWRRIVDHHDLVEGISHVPAFVDGGVRHDVVVVTPTRHHAVFDEYRIDGTIVCCIDDTCIDQVLERRFESTRPFVAFDDDDFLSHHRRRNVLELMDEARGCGDVATFILSPPALLERVTVTFRSFYFKGAFVCQCRESRDRTIVRGRHPAGVGKFRNANHNGIAGDSRDDRSFVVHSKHVTGVLQHTAVFDIRIEVDDGLCCARIKIAVAFQIHDDVTQCT